MKYLSQAALAYTQEEIQVNKESLFDFIKDAFLAGANWQQQNGEAIELLKKYEQWEADLLGCNDMWWPYAENDSISGRVYDKMLELQAERNKILNPTPPSSKE